MKNKNLFQKIAFPSLIGAILLFSAVPAIFSQSAMPAPKQEKLLNGLKVLMWSDAKADKVTVKIRINSGSAFDRQGKEGVMQLLADNLFPNQASRDFFAEDLGGGLDIVTNYDYIQINASSKPEGFLSMLETLATAVSNTAIDKETTLKLRNALLAKLKIKESDPAYVADQAVAKRLLGTFPYGRPQMGSTASVQKIDFADLIDAKQRFLTADNAAIAISGNYDKALGFKAVRRYFGGWLKADKRVPPTFRQPDEPDSALLKVEFPNLEKTYSRSAMVAPSRSDKDYYAMQILTKIWKDKFPYSDTEESECGKNSYQANLLRGIYQVRLVQNPGGSTFSRRICDLPSVGSYAYPEFKPADFEKAAAKSISEFNDSLHTTAGLADLWLDVDTYKLTSVDGEIRKINGVTLADVVQLAEHMNKVRTVSVLVATTPKASL